MQESLLRAWRSIAALDERGLVRAWPYKVATNRCLTAVERRSRRELPHRRTARYFRDRDAFETLILLAASVIQLAEPYPDVSPKRTTSRARAWNSRSSRRCSTYPPSDGIDAAMDGMQTIRSDPTLDGVASEAEGEQLPPSHSAVMKSRQSGDLPIDRSIQCRYLRYSIDRSRHGADDPTKRHPRRERSRRVIDAYALTLAALLLTADSIADLAGRRRVFAVGIATGVATFGSILATHRRR